MSAAPPLGFHQEELLLLAADRGWPGSLWLPRSAQGRTREPAPGVVFIVTGRSGQWVPLGPSERGFQAAHVQLLCAPLGVGRESRPPPIWVLRPGRGRLLCAAFLLYVLQALCWEGRRPCCHSLDSRSSAVPPPR